MTLILVVDDTAAKRRFLSKLAATVENDVHVASFGDPLAALIYAEKNTPDLVIADYKMVTPEGDRFIRRLRKLRASSDVPALVVSHDDEDAEFHDRAIEAESTVFLTPPIDHDDFLLRSRSLLAVRRQKICDAAFDAAFDDRVEADNAKNQMITDMLQTVNSHLTQTLTDLDRANNDLHNLLAITQIAAIFVDGRLCVRRFTDPVLGIYSLNPSDIGKPLTTIRSNLAYDDLTADFTRVGETAEFMEKYVAGYAGNSHYLMRITPYRLSDASIDGATITFTKVVKWHSGSHLTAPPN